MAQQAAAAVYCVLGFRNHMQIVSDNERDAAFKLLIASKSVMSSIYICAVLLYYLCTLFLQSWIFRYGGRYLAERKITSNTLSPADLFSMIAIENTASPSQRAYVVNARAVAVSRIRYCFIESCLLVSIDATTLNGRL